MTAVALALVQEVSEAGGEIRLEGETLRLSAPEPLPDDLRPRLRQHKAEIAALSRPQSRLRGGAGSHRRHRVGQDLPAEVAAASAASSRLAACGAAANRSPQIQRDMRHSLNSGWLQRRSNWWSTADLFGCDQRAPWHRLDRSGLVLLIGGQETSNSCPTWRRSGRGQDRDPLPAPAAGKAARGPPVGGAELECIRWLGPPAHRSAGPTAHPSEERMAATFLAGPRRHPDHDHS